MTRLLHFQTAISVCSHSSGMKSYSVHYSLKVICSQIPQTPENTHKKMCGCGNQLGFYPRPTQKNFRSPKAHMSLMFCRDHQLFITFLVDDPIISTTTSLLNFSLAFVMPQTSKELAEKPYTVLFISNWITGPISLTLCCFYQLRIYIPPLSDPSEALIELLYVLTSPSHTQIFQ